jgi:flagellar hook-length control protein FliK
MLANEPRQANNEEATQTYNAQTDARIKAGKEPFSKFVQALGAVTGKVPRKAEVAKASARQSLVHSVAEQPKAVQLWLAQYSQNLEDSPNGVATAVMPKAGYELAQLLSDLKADKQLFSAGKTAKTGGNQPQLNLGGGRISAKPVPNSTSGRWPTSSRYKDRVNASVMEVAGKLHPATKAPVGQQNAKEQARQALITESGDKAGANKKVSIAQNSELAGAHKTASLPGKEQKLDVLDAADGIEKALGEKAAVSRRARTLELDSSVPATQTKSSEPLGRPAVIDSGEPDVAVERPADRKTATGRILSGLTGKHGKDSQPVGNGLSGGSYAHGLRVTGLQTKNQGSSTSDYNSDLDQGPPLPQTNAQYSVEEAFSDTSVQSIRAENNTSNAATLPGVKEQLLESIHSSLRQDEQQLTIRLNPPELGKVSVKFQDQQSQITGVLEVSKAETKYEIEHALPEVIKGLQEAGIQIRRLEVVLTDQPEQQLFKDQSLQYGSFQQNLFSEGNSRGNGPSEEWRSSDNGYPDMAEPQMFVAEGSINMLV